MAFKLFPLQEPLHRRVPEEIEVPLLLGPLHAVAQHVLEVLMQLLVVYGAKEVPPGKGCLPRPPLRLFSLVPLSSKCVQQRLPAKDRKTISHPLHTQFRGHCVLFKGSVAVNLDTFNPATGNLGLF